jgi:hypothetical protein
MVIVANTTSPSWDQVVFNGTLQQNIDHFAEIYCLMYPYTLCPPSLFFEILRINALRQEASVWSTERGVDPNHSHTVYDLLYRIETFEPGSWAQEGNCYVEKLLIATIYRSASALYCIMSFQYLDILPNTLEMNSKRSIYGKRLLCDLTTASQSPRLVNFLMWPLTVAGVYAGYRESATQYIIDTQFSMLSRQLGTSNPLKAQAIFRRYWQRAERGWDMCFDRPYAFVT